MGKRTPSKWLTLMATCFGLLMLYIDLFIVNVALPTIAHDFRAPLGTVSWTVSGYVLMIGVRVSTLVKPPSPYGYEASSQACPANVSVPVLATSAGLACELRGPGLACRQGWCGEQS